MIEFNATFIIAMLSFVVFIMIMNAIFYRPVLNIIRKREEYINSNYEDSSKNEKTAKELEENRNSQINATQAKCRKDFYTAVNKLQESAAGKIKDAKENNKAIIQTEKDRLSKEKMELQQRLQGSVVEDLANSITEKLLNNNQVRVKQ